MMALQAQVDSLMKSSAPINSLASTTVTSSIASIPSAPVLIASVPNPIASAAPSPIQSTAPNPVPRLVPNLITNAAANLNAALQAGLGQPSHGYSGLTMENLRANPYLASQAAALLANATQNVPPLHPASQNVAVGGSHAFANQQVSCVDQLYRATTINKQLN